MARYKPQDHNSLLLPVVLSEQIIPGTFAFALNYLVDHELDLAPLDAQFKNDEVGAGAWVVGVKFQLNPARGQYLIDIRSSRTNRRGGIV